MTLSPDAARDAFPTREEIERSRAFWYKRIGGSHNLHREQIDALVVIHDLALEALSAGKRRTPEPPSAWVEVAVERPNHASTYCITASRAEREIKGGKWDHDGWRWNVVRVTPLYAASPSPAPTTEPKK